MKIRDEYILQEIAGKHVVIDTKAGSVNFNNIIALNDTGRFLWEKLEEGADGKELAKALEEELGADAETARKDAEEFIRRLKELECLENEET